MYNLTIELLARKLRGLTTVSEGGKVKMDFSIPFKICSSGLAAQRAKMDVITTNLANVGTTRTPEGGHISAREVVLGSRSAVADFDGRLQDVFADS